MKYLMELNRQIGGNPWAILGDFNALRSAEDKFGGYDFDFR
mgnify:FL=1